MIDEVESTYRQAVDKAKADYDAAVAKARTEMIERSAGKRKGEWILKVGDIVWIQGDSRLQGFGIDWQIMEIDRRPGNPTIVRVRDYRGGFMDPGRV